jgi:hypothetical protein
MSQLQILRVVVASPAEVKPERDLLPNVIDELNRGIAGDRGLRFELSRWETDAYPGFHPEGPQGLIDPILRVADCDLLIGIFWKRFGTPTTDGKTGTEHEFAAAYEAWKLKGSPQIFIYFNQKPYTPNSKMEIEQWGKVIDFRDQFPKEGLWWPYKGKVQFERLVRNHLTNYIRNLPKSGGESNKVIPPQKAEAHIQSNPVVMSAKKVFISYNHEDREVADKLRAALEKRGMLVIIDSMVMSAGGSIQEFIENSIRDADVTLSIVSNRSLLSAWVALESVTAFYSEKLRSDKKFIACYIDDDFFKVDYRLKATKQIKAKIEEIDQLIPEYFAEKIDTNDLNSQKTMLYKLHNNLGDILQKLRDSLTLDIRESEFDKSLARIVQSIEEIPSRP